VAEASDAVAGGRRDPRVIRLPSPRRLLRPEPALVLVAVTLLGAINAPTDLPLAASAGQDPASTTQVTSPPAPDALRWYDEVGRQDRAQRTGREYAVTLPSVAVLQTGPPTIGAAGGPVGVPAALWAAYRAAAQAAPGDCNLDPRLLAAIGQIESGSLAGRTLDARHRAVPPVLGPVLDGVQFARIADTDDGRLDGDRTWDRAVGPMQFIPSTWSRHGVDADGDGVADPQDIEDAALSAAGYLCAGGRNLADPGDVRAAILSYNHSTAYLAAVLALVPRVSAGGGLVLAGGAYRAPSPSGQGAPVGPAPSSSATRSPSATATASATPSSPTRTTTTTARPPSSTTTTTTTTTTATTAGPSGSSTTSRTTTTTSSPTSTTRTTTTTTTTSPTRTTTTTTTTSPTTSPSPSTTSTPPECDAASATATASSETASPTAGDTASPTPTQTCESSTTSPSSSPSTSSATATEAALESASAAPAAD